MASSTIVLSDSSESDESTTPVSRRGRNGMVAEKLDARPRPEPRRSALKATDLTRKIVTPKKEPRDGKWRNNGLPLPPQRKYRRRGGFYHYSGKHLSNVNEYESQHATRAAEKLGVRDVDPADDEYQPPWMPRTPRTPRLRGRRRKMVLYPSDEEYPDNSPDESPVTRVRSARRAGREETERRTSIRLHQSGLPTPEYHSNSRSASPPRRRSPSTRNLPPTLDFSLGEPIGLPDADAYETASEQSQDTPAPQIMRQRLDCVLVPADGEARLRTLESAIKLLQQENQQLRNRVQVLEAGRSHGVAQN